MNQMKPQGPANFKAFTIKFNGITHRITTFLEVFPAFDPYSQPVPSNLVSYKTQALWDTGATVSIITPSVIEALNLTPVGKSQMRHAGGTNDALTYVVNLGLPNEVMVTGVKVSEIPEQEFGAIIGMDVITSGDFAITNLNGETLMSFRYPSVQTIDYVVEANRLKYAGVNRNAPCPCGATTRTGKPIKFKNCHGKLA